MAKDKGGRPTVVTEEILHKLDEAFSLGCTDLEACLFAGISKSTLYNLQNKDKGFLERKEVLKENPVLLARQSVIKGFQEDSKLAMDYLKNKRSDEFNTKNVSDMNHKGTLEVVTGINAAPNTKSDD